MVRAGASSPVMASRTTWSILLGTTLLLVLLAIWHVGAAREAFVISSGDGSCKLEGVVKKRWFKTGDYGGWIFSDTEPEWVAARAAIEIEGHRYRLPPKLVRRMADPRGVEIARMAVGSGFDVLVTGGQGTGHSRLSLKFSADGLWKAEVEGVASASPWMVYP